mgnify:CR=1 FL=1
MLLSKGLAVYYWAVPSEELMRHVVDCGVDGMTIDIPDRLTEYLNEKG